MPTILFQASLFRTFQRVFKSRNPEHKEIVKFGVYIMRKFAELSKTNKKIYMELLFWKSKKEAYELEVGYGNSDSNSHSAKNVWREEQEDELRRLAAEYERETPEPDAVGWIMKNMIDQTRSRRAVIKKLKELYLVIGNMKPKSSIPKEFGEEEISELRAVYEQFKDSPDTMNCILGRLSVKRSRKAVIEKLLELGLISDKKELHRSKKPKKPSKSSENMWGVRSDDESIYDSWSDEDGGTTSTNKQKKQSGAGNPSQAQICCNLRKVLDCDLKDPLDWLLSSLQEVLDDLADSDDNDDEGIALLPLTATCVQAMNNPVFLQLLDILSIDKPTDQEVYWRIPGRWKSEDLKKRISLIKDALEDRLPDNYPDEVEEMVQFPGTSRASSIVSNEGGNKKLKNKTKKSVEKLIRKENADSETSSDASSSCTNTDTQSSRGSKHISRKNSSSESNNSEEESNSSSMKNHQKLKRPDSEKENDIVKANGPTSIGNNQLDSVLKAKRTERKLLKIDSDSESEGEHLTSTSRNKIYSKKKSKRKKFYDSSDSEVERTEDVSGNAVSSASHTNQFLRRKRLGIESESDNDTLNSSKASISSVSQSYISINADKEAETTINSTTGFPLSQNSEISSSTCDNTIKRRKRILKSDSDSDNNATQCNAKLAVSSPCPDKELNSSIACKNGAKRTRNNSSASDKIRDNSFMANSTRHHQTSSDSSDEDNNTTNISLMTGHLSTSQEREMSLRITSEKVASNSEKSDSDKERIPTLKFQTTNPNVALPSKRTTSSNAGSDQNSNLSDNEVNNEDSKSYESFPIKLSNTSLSSLNKEGKTKFKNDDKFVKRKRQRLEEDSDNESTIESLTDNILPSNHSIRLKDSLKSLSKRKRFSIESESDDDLAESTVNPAAPQTEIKHITVNSKRLVIDSDSDSELTINT